jgi:hypothetical protein
MLFTEDHSCQSHTYNDCYCPFPQIHVWGTPQLLQMDHLKHTTFVFQILFPIAAKVTHDLVGVFWRSSPFLAMFSLVFSFRHFSFR